MQPLRHIDPSELERFVEKYNQARMETWLGELLDRNASREFAAPGYDARLARLIREIIDAGRPASCLRLGDGEGNIMAVHDRDFRNLQRLCAQKAAEMHLGRWFSSSVLQLWSRAMYEAVENADVIGVPCTDRIRSLYRKLQSWKNGGRLDMRGACGTINALRYAHAVLLSRSEVRVVTNCSFHTDLLARYREILQGTPRVGLISCYPELAEKIRAAFCVAKVTFFAIPNQVSNIGRLPRLPHYPDVFTAVMKSLDAITPGQPVLVAAGLLGKIYCNRIKQCGGIALDIGSIADVWMGRRARRYHDAAYLEQWAL